VSFNMLQKMLWVRPFGPAFIRAARAHQRALLVWTVNDEPMMRWSIGRGVDGVITDDPKRLGDVCAAWVAGARAVRVRPADALLALWLWLMVQVFGAVLRWRYREGREPRKAAGVGGQKVAADM
jgi:phosphatidylglycerol phospholipase C